MTEEFAGAMVTVIPLLGSAEFLKVSGTFMERLIPTLDREGLEVVHKLLGRQHDVATPSQPEEPSPLERLGSMLHKEVRFWTNTAWLILACLHVYAEFRLIQWLATTERPEAPAMAQYVTKIATAGFVMLILGALAPPALLIHRRFTMWVIRKDITGISTIFKLTGRLFLPPLPDLAAPQGQHQTSDRQPTN
ncbi:hypothetical protein [Streptomyces sp. NPDC093089]|uniref:hypothetical protein n=1 Tax=Streptomyces sp. NPDC093089 TaxID=3366024 RepID=UPI0037FB02D3